MTLRRRPFSRPRTRVYDCNYNMGEYYYRSAIDSLDKKGQGLRQVETIEAPTRSSVYQPLSTELEASLKSDKEKAQMVTSDAIAASAAADAEFEAEIEARLRRIRAQAAAAVENMPSAEASYQSAFTARAEQTKNRYTEKMLESVGINSVTTEERETRRIKRSSRALREMEEGSGAMWSLMDTEPLVTTTRNAAATARLAELEAEASEMSERAAARQRRAAAFTLALES